MNLVQELKVALSVAKLNRAAFSNVVRRKETVMWGLVILLMPALVSLAADAYFFPSGFGVIFESYFLSLAFYPKLVLIGVIFLTPILAKVVFSLKLDFRDFFKIISYSSVVFWLEIVVVLFELVGVRFFRNFVPLIETMAAVVILAVSYKFLTEDYKFNGKYVMWLLIIMSVIYYMFLEVIGPFVL